MTIPSLVGPDGKTSLREYAGYHAGGGGFGGQLNARNPQSESADAALLPNFSRGNARADDLVRNNGYAANAVQLHGDHIVGSFFRLSYCPSWRYLGIKEEESRAFAGRLRPPGMNMRRMIFAESMPSASGRLR